MAACMPEFYALVDAMAGQEDAVAEGLAKVEGVRAVRVRERAHDFLIHFEAPGFDVVDDFLQTYVRPLQGVMGVEVVTDWDDVGPDAKRAREQLG